MTVGRGRQTDAEAVAQALVGYLSVGRLALSVEEFAQAVGLSAWTVHELCRRGQIPHVRIGKRRLIPVATAIRWLDEKAATGAVVEV